MITYFDTSVFVPLIVDEPTSDDCRELWLSSERRVSTRLLFVEVSAALGRVSNEGRISTTDTDRAIRALRTLWGGIEVLELDHNLMVAASALAGRFRLRGYDSVHCAAALEVEGEDTLAATADIALSQAWSGLGLTVFSPGTA